MNKKLLCVLLLAAQSLFAQVTTLNVLSANIGTMTVPVPPFNPTNVAGLYLWYETDNLAQSAGTKITSWTNRVAATNDWTQPSTTLAPYVTNYSGLNGNYPWLAFVSAGAGSACFFTNTMSFAVSNNYPRTMIFAMRMQDTNGYNTIISDWATDSGYFHAFYHSGVWTIRNMISGQFNATAASAWQIFSIVVTNGSNASKVYTNGVLCAAGTLGDGTYFGSPVLNADRSGSSQQNSGLFECSAVIIYTNALSDTNRYTVESWLKTKYGI